MNTLTKSALTVTTMLSLGASGLHAANIFALDNAQNLFFFDSITGASTAVGAVTGAGTNIVDIDFSPVNGRLYGLGANGSLFILSTTTGAAMLAITPSTAFANTPTTIDFNPQADRMRIFGINDSNFRLTPDGSAWNNGGLTSGVLTNDGTLGNTALELVGAAYTNNFDGTTSTQLYTLDNATDSLYLHSVGPQFNTATLVGSLGVSIGSDAGFDIAQNGIAYVTDGTTANVYQANLANGSLGGPLAISGGLIPATIAVQAVPEASSSLLAGLAGALLLRRRSRASV
jgi:hypothetical protein